MTQAAPYAPDNLAAKTAMTSLWVVMNIGFLECGASSNIVGVFSDKTRANAIAQALGEVLKWRLGGHCKYEVFPLPAMIDVLEPEYAAALAARHKGGLI